jgi:Uncharacterized conserved protein
VEALEPLYEVGVKLIDEVMPKHDKVVKTWEILTTDEEIEAYLEMSNVFTVKRLYYNDHGPVTRG